MKKLLLLGLLSLLTWTAGRAVSWSGKSDYTNLMRFPSPVLVQWGDSLYVRSVLDSALVCYTIVSGRYESRMEREEKEQCAYAYFRAGNIHYRMYSYVRAQDMYHRSLEICQETECDSLLPRVYNNLGNIYSSFNDFRTAEAYYRRAYDDYHTGTRPEFDMMLVNNLIGVYCNLRDGEALRHYLNLSETLLGDASGNYFYQAGWGALYFNEGGYAASIECHKRARAIADSLHFDPLYTCTALSNIAEAFLQMQQRDSAEYYLKSCVRMAEKNGLLDKLLGAYRNLSMLYSETGNASQFLHYTQLYQQMDDSIQGLQGYRNLREVEFLFEVNQIDKQLETLRMEQVAAQARFEVQRLLLCIVTAALVAIVWFLWLIERKRRSLQRSYEDIFARNREIVASQAEARRRYQLYQQQIAEKDRQLDELRRKVSNQEVSASLPEADEGGKEADVSDGQRVKYQNSNLTEEHRADLLQGIRHVMEETEEFLDADFSLEKMAQLVGSTSRYVSQVINETYGKNFNRYVNEYRVKEARARLQNQQVYGQYTVRAIAQSVGFRSMSNFNQLFKEVIGLTPSMYLNMVKNQL